MSFWKRTITDITEDLNVTERELFELNEQFQNLSPILYRYVSGTMVEETVNFVGQWEKIFRVFGTNGIVSEVQWK